MKQEISVQELLSLIKILHSNSYTNPCKQYLSILIDNWGLKIIEDEAYELFSTFKHLYVGSEEVKKIIFNHKTGELADLFNSYPLFESLKIKFNILMNTKNCINDFIQKEFIFLVEAENKTKYFIISKILEELRWSDLIAESISILPHEILCEKKKIIMEESLSESKESKKIII